MQYVQAGAFSFNYGAYDQDASLPVSGLVYDITTGSPVLKAQGPMSEAANGVYTGAYAGSGARTYLTIAAAYTDNTYTTPDLTRGPAAECYQVLGSLSPDVYFNYVAEDQATGLFIEATIFDVTSGMVEVGTVAMTFVALGVYIGVYSGGEAGHTYLVQKSVYLDSGYTNTDPNRSPGADSIQILLSPLPPVVSTDPGIQNVRYGTEYEINGVSLVGAYVARPVGGVVNEKCNPVSGENVGGVVRDPSAQNDRCDVLPHKPKISGIVQEVP